MMIIIIMKKNNNNDNKTFRCSTNKMVLKRYSDIFV